MVDFTGGTWRSLIDGTEIVAIPDTAGLQGHWDATEISATDGDGITTWTDQSGAGNDLEGGNPIYRENEIGNNPALDFDPTDDILSTNNQITQNNNLTIFAVGYVDGEGHALNYRQSDPGFFIMRDGDVRLEDDSGSRTTINIGWGGTTPVVAMGELVDDDGLSIRSRINGSDFDSSSHGSGNLDSSTFHVNDDPERDNPCGCTFGEILLYTESKSSSQIQDIEAYLNGKWSIY